PKTAETGTYAQNTDPLTAYITIAKHTIKTAEAKTTPGLSKKGVSGFSPSSIKNKNTGKSKA
ncbi:MAG: hypothetical protein FWC67_04825, partial [Defluviitaleaceae bacterium]|nr:hypothetical protein [Defluviitaleaceae bacterium]